MILAEPFIYLGRILTYLVCYYSITSISLRVSNKIPVKPRLARRAPALGYNKRQEHELPLAAWEGRRVTRTLLLDCEGSLGPSRNDVQNRRAAPFYIPVRQAGTAGRRSQRGELSPAWLCTARSVNRPVGSLTEQKQ